MLHLLAGRQRKALAACYFSYFALVGLMLPYLGLYLDHLGFNSVEIGSLFSILFLTRLLAPNFWAVLADRTGKPVKVIQWGAGLAMVTVLGLFAPPYFSLLAAVLFLYTFFWNGILSQLEVTTLASLKSRPEQYGALRSFGSLGYIVVVIAAGWYFDVAGPGCLPALAFGFFVALFLGSLALKDVDRPTSTRAEASQSFWALLNRRPVWAFLLSAMLLQISHSPFYGFFVLYLKGLGVGESLAGVIVAMGTVAEIGVFLLAPRLLARFALVPLLVFCFLMAVARWGLTDVVGANPAVQIAVQALHAFSFGLAHACAIQFIHQQFKGPHQAKAQALYASISFGLGGAIGAYLAGLLWQNGAGATNTWWGAAAAAALGLCCVLAMMEGKGSKDDQRRRLGEPV